MSTLVIAEAGVNHNGDPEIAGRLVDAAAEAGADFVKFQTFRAKRLLTRFAGKANYQKISTESTESQFDMLSRLELSREDHEFLIGRCQACGIGFLSTAFDAESLDLLVELGQKQIKISSGDITNMPYLRHVGGFGMPVLLSTGMADMGEVEVALGVLEDFGVSRERITLLHCNTEYPTPMTDVNLRAMESMKRQFGVRVGYSDHTQGIEVAVAATAMGASVIEKHLTLNRGFAGPDHSASLEPGEFVAMVRSIRNIELALGDGVKRASPSEIGNRLIVRKSLVASAPIAAGEMFTVDNVTVKRPGSGLSPMLWDKVIGTTAPRDFQFDELIHL